MAYHIILYVTRRKWGNTGISRCFDDITYSSFWTTRGEWGWENMMWNMMDAMSWCRLWWLKRRWKRERRTYFHEREVERIRQETIQICYTWGGGWCWWVGEVMFFNTTRSHAMVIRQVLLLAWQCRPNYGLLFFKSNPPPASRVSSAGVLLNIWFIVRSNDTEQEWKTFGWVLNFGIRECFSRYTTAPSLDTNTIPSSYESTSSLQQYYQHKESLFLLMLCNHYL